MATCKGCGAEIIFAKTVTGKNIPLDAKTDKRIVIEAGEAILIDTYVAHFTTCPKAELFRKNK